MPRSRRLLGCAALSLGLVAPAAQAQDQQAELFRTRCAACHTIGGGRLVGPDLQGVAERRTEDWIIRFVQHPQDMVRAGDPQAVALFEEYGRVPMPDQQLSDQEIQGLLAYIARAVSTPAPAPAPEVPAATDEQVRLGRDLFQGAVRFTNGGPTCIACHHVTNDAVNGGGVLARDLTTVFSRLGGPGVRAILASPPFPVMERAYAGRVLTQDEVAALVGFLQRADAEHALQQPRDYGLRLFGAGLVGTVLLLGVYSVLWSGRRRASVNQAIYDRQITSI